MMRHALPILLALVPWAAFAMPATAADARPKKIVLVAGTKSHGPGHHEYEKGARLLKACLDSSPNVPPLVTEVHTDGWPSDEKTFDDADTIFFFCDGSDRDVKAHPLLVGDRLATIQRQMRRGCGLVALHYTIFVPNDRGGPQLLDWIGGFFDYQSGPGERGWYSKIGTHATKPRPATPDHPICRGLAPFDLSEEYYYNLRFRANDKRLTPILMTEIPGERDPQVVAYAVERTDGGRGFGFSGGHFHSNWQVENFRKMMLNALLWTAHAEVPAGGVKSTLPDEAKEPGGAGDVHPAKRTGADDARPIKTLLVTGHQHPAHAWRETTPALVEALAGRDRRFKITIEEDPEFLAKDQLRDFDLVVLNYCNWQRPGLSEAARQNFVKYLASGGGLAIIHFANGAFHFSLPGSGEGDWPEYRTKICRRVWDHRPGHSGHDPYGPFRVDVADAEHEITRGLKPFETTDELYYRQQGDEPIHVLATAHSRDTGRDEPMAFVYDYGKGRVFQTVLGHDAAAIRNPGTAALVRRACAWAAGRKPLAAAAPDALPSDASKKASVPAQPAPTLVEAKLPDSFSRAILFFKMARRENGTGSEHKQRKSFQTNVASRCLSHFPAGAPPASFRRCAAGKLESVNDPDSSS
ncbi:MAG: ThuA domain-containing protein [Planctomycetia bacterium]|nr:ThuA domain-containing protein [Planctomycetia bacterium]